MVSITPQMARALTSPRRRLALMFRVEGAESDLYCWSGLSSLEHDGQTWIGVAHVAEVDALRSNDGLEYIEQKLTLNGLDPSLVGDIDATVRGRSVWVWLASMNDAGQVIPDKILLRKMRQETLALSIKTDGTMSLGLSCSMGLPFVGRSLDANWSDETQRLLYSGDEGFYYTRDIALAGIAVDWRAG